MAAVILTLHTPARGQEVITSAGDFHSAGGYSVSWTIGEPVIETFTSGSTVLTQGFQQPILISVSIYENPELNFEINVFPNPTSDFLNVIIPGENYDEMQYFLFDAAGKLLDNRNIVSEQTQIMFTHMSVAVYFIKIIHGDKVLKTFRIVKQ
jgi:hypothetical protein